MSEQHPTAAPEADEPDADVTELPPAGQDPDEGEHWTPLPIPGGEDDGHQ